MMRFNRKCVFFMFFNPGEYAFAEILFIGYVQIKYGNQINAEKYIIY